MAKILKPTSQSPTTPSRGVHPHPITPGIFSFECVECLDTGELEFYSWENGPDQEPCSCTELDEKDKYYLTVRNV